MFQCSSLDDPLFHFKQSEPIAYDSFASVEFYRLWIASPIYWVVQRDAGEMVMVDGVNSLKRIGGIIDGRAIGRADWRRGLDKWRENYGGKELNSICGPSLAQAICGPSLAQLRDLGQTWATNGWATSGNPVFSPLSSTSLPNN
jgi:hypothetical protein